MLAKERVDCSACIEKKDLEALWRHVMERRAAQQSSRQSQQPPPPPDDKGKPAPAAIPAAQQKPPEATAGRSSSSTSLHPEAQEREKAAAAEVSRIRVLRKAAFPTHAAWGFAVLDLKESTADAAAVQRSYRTLMKRLHPDRVGQTPGIADAMEVLREAKTQCERALSQEHPPSQPRRLRAEVLCSDPGKRQVRLHWEAPELRQGAPVRRYVVAAMDPAYGRALTVAVLEPDYSEALHRFVPVEELDSFLLAEQEMQKMPGLFRQAAATLQVAAANDAGQSPWATVRVAIVGAVPSAPAAAASSGAAAGGSTRAAARGAAAAKGRQPPCKPANSPDGPKKCKQFEAQMRQHQGKQLRAWLEKQKKEALAAWLRSKSRPSLGTKEELLERVLVAAGGRGPRR